jgi:hypothetical protein
MSISGFKHYSYNKPLPSIVELAVRTSIYIWAMALKNMAPYINNYTILPKMSCNQSYLKFWNDGGALYR